MENGIIEVVVNGEAKRVPSGLDVTKLLELLDVKADRVAVELNRSIVRKQDWSSTPIEAGAHIEVVWFVGGGA